METLKCHLWSARRAQPLAELSQAERSEAQPREARPPPKAAGAVRRPGAEGDPRASRGLQTKARMRLYWQRLSSWRLNSLGRRESVLCTNGISWKSTIKIIITNSGAGIGSRQVKLQTRRSQKIKPHDHSYCLSSRERIPTEESRAENDQRCRAHT